MNWSTTSPRPVEQAPAPVSLEAALSNLKRQVQSGGFIMLTKDQALAVIAKLEPQQ